VRDGVLVRFLAGDRVGVAYSARVKQNQNGSINKWRVLIGVAVALASVTVAQSGQRVTEKTGGFSYALPKGWNVRTLPGLKYQIAYAQPSKNFAPNVNFVDEAYTGSVADYVKLNKENIVKAKLGYVFTAEKAFTTDHVGQAVRLEAKTEQQGKKLSQIFYFLEGKTRKFVATCSRLIDQPATTDAGCDAIVKSFKLE
jgi:hypothetical protein